MIFFIVIVSLFFYSTNLFAYIGLGPLIPILGNALVFIFFTVISIIGVFFYPIKKILSIRKKTKEKNNGNKKNQ